MDGSDVSNARILRQIILYECRNFYLWPFSSEEKLLGQNVYGQFSHVFEELNRVQSSHSLMTCLLLFGWGTLRWRAYDCFLAEKSWRKWQWGLWSRWHSLKTWQNWPWAFWSGHFPHERDDHEDFGRIPYAYIKQRYFPYILERLFILGSFQTTRSFYSRIKVSQKYLNKWHWVAYTQAI